MTVTLPYHFSLIYETDPVPYLKDGVHVVGVDHRGHVEFPGKVADEAVDKDGGIWVQTGIRLIAEKEGRIEGNGPGYADTFLHSATELIGVFVVRPYDVDLFKTILCPFFALCIGPVRKEFHREHHIFKHCSEVEQGAPLEQYADVLPEGHAFLIAHFRHLPLPVYDFSAVRGHQTHEIFQQDRLSRSAGTYYHVAFAGLVLDIDVFQDLDSVKAFI